MIRRIHIEGYKSINNLEVRPRPLTVLFGPNAAGKSNFLDAIQLLSRAVTARTLKEAFEAPYRGMPLESFTFDPEGIAGHLKKNSLKFTIEVDVDLSTDTVNAIERQIAEMRSGAASSEPKREIIRERSLRYRLTIEILPKSGILRVADEYLAALKSNGQLKTSRKPFLERQERRLHLRLEGQAHPTFHEIGLDHTLVSRPLYPPHYPHLAAFRRELAGWSFFYFEPRERMRASNPVKEVRQIGLMGEDLAAFLNTLRVVDSSHFRAIEKALHTLIPRVQGIDVEPNNLGEVELRLLEDGVAVPARLVSEGTLRMLGLLAVAGAKDTPTLVAFEEPENGIHPRRIQFLAEFFKSRSVRAETQFIITTHSSLLPDLLPSNSLFVCRREKASTIIKPFIDDGPLLRQPAIQSGLEDKDENDIKISERILRGDFDA